MYNDGEIDALQITVDVADQPPVVDSIHVDYHFDFLLDEDTHRVPCERIFEPGEEDDGLFCHLLATEFPVHKTFYFTGIEREVATFEYAEALTRIDGPEQVPIELEASVAVSSVSSGSFRSENSILKFTGHFDLDRQYQAVLIAELEDGDNPGFVVSPKQNPTSTNLLEFPAWPSLLERSRFSDVVSLDFLAEFQEETPTANLTLKNSPKFGLAAYAMERFQNFPAEWYIDFKPADALFESIKPELKIDPQTTVSAERNHLLFFLGQTGNFSLSLNGRTMMLMEKVGEEPALMDEICWSCLQAHVETQLVVENLDSNERFQATIEPPTTGLGSALLQAFLTTDNNLTLATEYSPVVSRSCNFTDPNNQGESLTVTIVDNEAPFSYPIPEDRVQQFLSSPMQLTKITNTFILFDASTFFLEITPPPTRTV
eukprot:GABV01000008.1.p1 GENE.GABV01000008.1~~GABV01000008.1.p1  ORF type:complete len:499 (+),score=244.49 GABV01000008.1:211-1497(+)